MIKHKICITLNSFRGVRRTSTKSQTNNFFCATRTFPHCWSLGWHVELSPLRWKDTTATTGIKASSSFTLPPPFRPCAWLPKRLQAARGCPSATSLSPGSSSRSLAPDFWEWQNPCGAQHPGGSRREHSPASLWPAPGAAVSKGCMSRVQAFHKQLIKN